jgi:hypothetical protein
MAQPGEANAAPGQPSVKTGTSARRPGDLRGPAQPQRQSAAGMLECVSNENAGCKYPAAPFIVARAC